jgi:hypothetical protein
LKTRIARERFGFLGRELKIVAEVTLLGKPVTKLPSPGMPIVAGYAGKGLDVFEVELHLKRFPYQRLLVRSL